MRCAVLSDIHGNLAALEAVLKDAEEQFQVESYWSLGDLVDYGPQPNECIERIHSLGAVCMAGNHDRARVDNGQLGRFADDVSTTFHLAELETVNLARIAAWPYAPQQPSGAGDFTLVHGSPRDPLWEYVHSWPIAKHCFPLLTTRFCLVGHTHVPCILEQMRSGDGCREWSQDEIAPGRWIPLKKHRLIINPGSVGQPRRDGDPRAAYLVLDLSQGEMQFRRVSYPIEETQSKMAELGFPVWMIRKLEFGW